MHAYYTVIIPYASPAKRTQWHPTEAQGPFATLSRGAFATEAEARAWADARLNGAPYQIRFVR